MYDLIADLKATMKEERDMYREHLAQHDDLLALLAQQDLERASLQEALTNASGSDAVDEAIQAAKSRASDRFGEYVILD